MWDVILEWVSNLYLNSVKQEFIANIFPKQQRI